MDGMRRGISGENWLELSLRRSRTSRELVLYELSNMPPGRPRVESQSSLMPELETTYLNTFAFLTTSVCNCTTAGAMTKYCYQYWRW